jgi:hypothetical protein
MKTTEQTVGLERKLKYNLIVKIVESDILLEDEKVERQTNDLFSTVFVYFFISELICVIRMSSMFFKT